MCAYLIAINKINSGSSKGHADFSSKNCHELFGIKSEHTQ